MYKLVIVEDEEIIRHSLERFIPWNTIGFQIVNTFSDGTDALAYIKENPCDAVLTDILMNKMSGLEMIRELHKANSQIKVVILSGHSDFSYAQQAIEYKVVHYLVKPVDEEDLINVFRRVKEQLDNEREEIYSLESETQSLKHLLQKSFFRDLLSGNVGLENELNVYFNLLGINRIKQDSPLLAYEIKTTKILQEERGFHISSTFIDDELKKLLTPAEDLLYFAIEERIDKWRVIFVSLRHSADQELTKYCTHIVETLVGKLSGLQFGDFTFRLTHSVMRIGDLLTETRASTNQDECLTEQKMEGVLYKTVMSEYKLLLIELDLGTQDALIHILDRLFFGLKEVPLAQVRFVLKKLYSMIELNYKKRKIDVWEITEGKFDPNHLSRRDSLEGVKACVKDDFCTLCESLANNTHEPGNGVIGRIVKYLKEHIEDDISHDAIAAMYRIHPGYLSRLFKQEMGETLSEYFLRIKVEKAAELLKSGRYKVGEIAVMVGYSASSYFSIMFKKYTGYSPKEYSQRISL